MKRNNVNTTHVNGSVVPCIRTSSTNKFDICLFLSYDLIIISIISLKRISCSHEYMCNFMQRLWCWALSNRPISGLFILKTRPQLLMSVLLIYFAYSFYRFPVFRVNSIGLLHRKKKQREVRPYHVHLGPSWTGTVQLAQQPTDNHNDHNNVVGQGDHVLGREAVGSPAPIPIAKSNEESSHYPGQQLPRSKWNWGRIKNLSTAPD